jgi:hypothetical protein
MRRFIGCGAPIGNLIAGARHVSPAAVLTGNPKRAGRRQLHASAVEHCGMVQQFVWNLNFAIRNSASVGLV